MANNSKELMNQERLTKLLAVGPLDHAGASPDCPDEHLIAGYADGTLDAATREEVERHAADCGHCLNLIALLCQEHVGNRAGAEIPDTPAKARKGFAKWPLAGWRLAPQWAAAAALILAMPLLFYLGREPQRGFEGQGSPAPSTTRSVASTDRALRVLTPVAGAAVNIRDLTISWTQVSETPYYDVRIVTDAGDVIARQRVTGTSWIPSPPLHLLPGEEYFVLVDAYPSGNKAVSSRHVPFRISD